MALLLVGPRIAPSAMSALTSQRHTRGGCRDRDSKLSQSSEFSPAAEAVASLSAERAIADAADLQTSLADLAGLVSASSGLGGMLAQVAAFTVHAIPGADGAGVTVLRVDGSENRVEALAASHPFVREIDEIQYVTLKEGPCITAALERRTVRSGSLGGEKDWPRFGPRVGRLGVHSALSLPLLLGPGPVVGTINVYARAEGVFDDHAAHLGELFATPAAVAVHNAQLLAQAEALAAQLQSALSTRPVIDQAIGLLRGRSGDSAEEAFIRLRGISQREHVKLAVVAQRVVEEAVRRADARRTPE
jgi:GAF domain-containing protein